MSFFVIEQQNDQAVAAKPVNQQIGPTMPQHSFSLLLGILMTYATKSLMETWLSILPVLAMEIVVWWWAALKIREGWPGVSRVLILSTHTAFLAVLVVTAWCYVQKSPYVLGSPSLRGLVVSGIPVPSSDFRWATNGVVEAIPGYGVEKSMKIAMTLGDRENCDAGWGMDLLRFDFRRFKFDYDPRLALMKEIEFEIRGANGGEPVGISMKSDGVGPSGTVSSDETRVPLSNLRYTVTKEWQHVHVPFTRFPRLDNRSVRNVALYTDSSMGGALNEPIIVEVRDIKFVPRNE